MVNPPQYLPVTTVGLLKTRDYMFGESEKKNTSPLQRVHGPGMMQRFENAVYFFCTRIHYLLRLWMCFHS